MSSASAFPPTANPAGYVASAGSERALEELERWALGEGKPVCVLRGPPGMGKTLLLKLFAARVADRFETAFVPHPDCDPDALCRAVLAALGVESGKDPRAGLARALEAWRSDAPQLLVAIDEADFLPRETATWLVDLARSSAGAVRALLATTDGTGRAGLPAALAAKCETVKLDGALSRRQLETYVHGELERAGVDRAICASFDPSALAELHARSGGVPGALRLEATRILFRAELARGEVVVLRPPSAHASVERQGGDPPHPERVALAEAPSPAPSPPWRRPSQVAAGVLGLAAGLYLAWGLATSKGGFSWLAPAPAAVAEGPRVLPRGAPMAPAPDVAAAPLPAERAPPSPAARAPRAAEPREVSAAPRSPEPRAPSVAVAAPPAPVRVFVAVNAEPWAEIEIDGKPVGETPIARLAVEPGRHRLAARMPDGRVLSRDVHIEESGARIVFP